MKAIIIMAILLVCKADIYAINTFLGPLSDSMIGVCFSLHVGAFFGLFCAGLYLYEKKEKEAGRL